jgi:hypothetical protein
MINKIIFILILFIGTVFASPSYSLGTTTGRGSTKVEAYIQALGRLPGGAIPMNVGYNGSSSANTDGTEYRGNYICVITWKKYETP